MSYSQFCVVKGRRRFGNSGDESLGSGFGFGFGVALGNGEAIQDKGVCKGIRLLLGDVVEGLEEFLPLELGNSYVIFGNG